MVCHSFSSYSTTGRAVRRPSAEPYDAASEIARLRAALAASEARAKAAESELAQV